MFVKFSQPFSFSFPQVIMNQTPIPIYLIL